MMNKSVEDEYKAFELYLQQAQEEIGQTFSGESELIGKPHFQQENKCESETEVTCSRHDPNEQLSVRPSQLMTDSRSLQCQNRINNKCASDSHITNFRELAGIDNSPQRRNSGAENFQISQLIKNCILASKDVSTDCCSLQEATNPEIAEQIISQSLSENVQSDSTDRQRFYPCHNFDSFTSKHPSPRPGRKSSSEVDDHFLWMQSRRNSDSVAQASKSESEPHLGSYNVFSSKGTQTRKSFTRKASLEKKKNRSFTNKRSVERVKSMPETSSSGKISSLTDTRDDMISCEDVNKVEENSKGMENLYDNLDITHTYNPQSFLSQSVPNESCLKEINNNLLLSKNASKSEQFEPTEYDSSDMQVMVNALTPVICRRRSSKKGKREGIKNNTPDQDSLNSGKENTEIMNPDMAHTWHGQHHLHIPQFPKMGIKQIRSTPFVQYPKISNSSSGENLDPSDGSQHKTLLDAMHKRFCAYQYVNKRSRSAEGLETILYLSPTALPEVKRPLNNARHHSVGDTGTASSSPPESTHSSPALRHCNSLRLPNGRSVPKSPKLGLVKNMSSKSKSSPQTSVTPKRIQLDPPKQQNKDQAEIEAEEASRWLRAAGFPQYAQMYEDGEFPIDISSVEKDHDFLDKDQIQSIFRRLNTLNKCAIMKIEAPSRKLRHEESDDEDQCALSDKWKYQRTSRRWSRKDLDLSNLDSKHVYKLKSTTSQDSLLQDQDNSSPSGGSPVFDSRVPHTGNHVDGNVLSLKNSGTSAFSPKLRRAASERIKSAKNLLRKVESFKTKRPRTTRKHPKTALDISGPVINDSEDMQAKIQHLNCVDISPTGEQPPLVNNSADQSALLSSNDNSRLLPEGDISQTSDNTFSLSTSHSMPFSSSSSYSDNPTHTSFGAIHETPRSVRRNQSENDLQEVFILPIDHKPGSFPKVLSNGYIETPSGQGINYRTGSFNLGKDSDNYRNNVRLRPPTCRRGSNDSLDSNRVSVYDNVHEEDLEAAHRELDIILHELFQNINGLNKALNCESDTDIAVDTSIQEDKNKKEETLESSFILDSPESIIKDEQSIDTDDHDNVSGSATSNDSSDHDLPHEELLHDENMDSVWRERRDSGVGSSLTRPCDRKRIRWHSFQKSHRPSLNSRSLQLCSLSVGQYMVFRKVALLKLTSLLEKYSPTNRTGWNWSVPRFMKRHKSPEYSDKSLFAVPLLLTLQRTGQPLPQCILFAMRYLRRTCNDAVGIFRKSGVRSRIQKLREDLESNPDVVSFEDLQAYDVADLLKQFFRDLPDCLLTSKLSETFISIFTHVPPDLRFEAMQAAIILMPDENREVLQCLLLFLSDISQCSDEHQMTASNLAVCFAPSLFNVCNMKGSLSASPKRNRKNHGTPDVKEIMEQKAAHDCLTSMIHECKKLFTIPVSWLSQCRFSYMEQSDTITMEQLNKDSYDGEQGYKYLTEQWIQGILKESHDKFKGWVHLSTQKGVDVSFKKVGDGHPLRLWKATIDVEAPPIEVLNRLLTERHLWDEDLLKWRVVEKLDKDTDVFQFVRNAMAPHPTRDYCVLRAWKSNLPRGTCVFVSSSIEHPQADLIGGIRAVELASRYLIEPCGAGKSRVTHISRIDTKGMSSDWYNKSYGHICRLYMMKIRDSFKQKASGPETKV